MILIIILVAILLVDGLAAYWLAKRLVILLKDNRFLTIYRGLLFTLFFFILGALSLYLIASNIRLQR